MPADCHIAGGEGGGKGPGSGTGEGPEYSRLLFSRGARSGAREVERNVGTPNGNARRGRVRTEAERATHQAFADAEREALGRGHRALERAREFAGAPLHRRRHRATRTRRGKVVAGGGRRREQTARAGASVVMAHAGVPHVIISRCAADLRITRSRPLGRPPLALRRDSSRAHAPATARPQHRDHGRRHPRLPRRDAVEPPRLQAGARARHPRRPAPPPRTEGSASLSPARRWTRPTTSRVRRARARRPATGAPNDLAAVPPRRSPSPR